MDTRPTDLSSRTTPRPVAPDEFEFEVLDGWQQGRGAFGGLVLATMARTILQVSPSRSQRLRTLTAALPGPTLVGVANLAVETLRAGSGTTTIAVRLVQQGELRAHAVGVLGRDRPRDVDVCAMAQPVMVPWRDVAPLPAGVGAAFAQHFEFRNTGPLPFSQSSSLRASGWVRAREPGALRDEAFLIALIDAWWPSNFSTMTAPRPMATIAFTAQITGDCSDLDPIAPLYYDAHADAIADGFLAETRTLWSESGRLLAINTQTFVIIQ